MRVLVNRLRVALILAIFASLPFVGLARPDRNAPPVELTSASLHVGATPRVPAYGWATWNFAVRNKSEVEATVDLQLKAIAGRASAVHETSLTVPAGFTLRSSVPVLLDSAERYETSLFVQGNKVDFTESLLRVLSSNKHLVWLVNDDDEVPVGDIARNEHLHRDFETVYCGADRLPRHWAGFGNTHALVMVRPDFSSMSSHTVQAIERWVARGGTLLFLEPTGILEASESLLGELLPVVPMRKRKLEKLTALTAIGGQELSWPEGIDFLEAVPHERGISTLVEGAYPVARFHRHHLGVVGCTLVYPGEDGLRNTDDFNKLWRHLLAFGGTLKPASATASPELDQSLSLLTGVTIPEASVIRRVVVLYLLVVLVAVMAGYICRRRLAIWAGLAAFAFVTTLFIFHIANTRGSRKSRDLASVIRIEPGGAVQAGSDQVTALYTKKEQNISITTAGIDQRLRPHMDLAFGGIKQKKKDRSKVRHKRPNAGVRDVLQIGARDSVMGMDDHLLRDSALLRYSCETSAQPGDDIAAPQIDWQAEPALSDWTAPPHLSNAKMAFAACEAGIMPMLAEGDQVAFGDQGILPPELQNLRDFFTLTGHRLPSLALVHTTDSGHGIPDGFKTHGKRVTLLPIHQTIGGEEFLPAARVRLSASSPGARRLRFRGQWQPLHQSNAPTTAVFDLFLPATHTQLTAERVTVEFQGENRGQNLAFTISVAAHDGDENSAIPPSRVDGNSYHFEQLPAGLVHPTDGLFRVVLVASPIKQLPPEQALRTNSWEVRKFAVSVSGKLPPHVKGSF